MWMNSDRLVAAILLGSACAPLAAEAPRGLRTASLEVLAPSELEGIPRSAANPAAKRLDYQISFDRGGDSITIYVFRATHPNAAVWFERADSVLTAGRQQWQLSEPTAIERVTAFGSSAPNGLRRAYRADKVMKSTGLAVVQVNDWIVKVRSSSATLDRDQQLVRLERVLAQLSVNVVQRPPHPLDLPERCAASPSTAGRAILPPALIDSPTTVHAMTAGLLATGYSIALAGGTDSLAAKPGDFCRAVLEGPMSELASLYRAKSDNGHWEVIFADSGKSFSGHYIPAKSGAAQMSDFGMFTLNDFDRSSVLFLTKGSPDPAVSSSIGALVLMGRVTSQSLTTVHFDRDQIDISLPEGAAK